MGLMVKEIIIVTIYTIGINLILSSLSTSVGGVSCPNVYDLSNQDVSLNETELQSGISSNPVTMISSVVTIFNLITNQCTGIPYILVLICELPILIGILYIVRGFIGAT